MSEFRQYLPHLSVFLVAFCLYAGTVTHEHVLDDLELIPNQPDIRNPWNVRAILFGRYWESLREQDTLYRPFTIWTLGINYWMNEVVGVAGTHPGVYRMSNALLHALVSGLACAFFLRLGVGIMGAWIGALLFAVHPIHTEAVAAAVNRSECLALGFGLGMLVLHWRRAGHRWAVLCLGGALLSKESSLMFLPFLLWMDWTLRKDEMHWRQYWCYGLVIAGWFVLRNLAIGDAVQVVLPIDNPLVEVSIAHRVWTALWVQFDYLYLQVLPLGLSSDYSFKQIPVVTSVWNGPVLIFVLSAVVGCLIAWRGKERFPIGLFALGGYGILFGLTANIILPVGTVMAERLVYAPSLCFCLLVACGLCRLPGRMVFPVVFLLVLVLSGMTLARNRVWANGQVFYRAQVMSAPRSAKAHYSVARGVYHPEGDLDRARFHYERAVNLMPNYPDAWNNLGMVFKDQGNVAAAENAYQTALRWHPGHVKVRFNFAQLLQEKSENDQAIAMYEAVLRGDANHVAACNNLAVLYIQAGQIDTARALLERALRVNADYEAARINWEKLRILDGR